MGTCPGAQGSRGAGPKGKDIKILKLYVKLNVVKRLMHNKLKTKVYYFCEGCLSGCTVETSTQQICYNYSFDRASAGFFSALDNKWCQAAGTNFLTYYIVYEKVLVILYIIHIIAMFSFGRKEQCCFSPIRNHVNFCP